MHYLKRALILLRCRGPKYLIYLLMGYLMPILAYQVTRQVTPYRYRRVMLLALVCGAVLVWVGFVLWLGWLPALWIGLTGAVVFILAWWMAPRFYLSYLERRAADFQRNALAYEFTAWETWPVSDVVRQAVALHQKSSPGEEITLGRIDNDGRVSGAYGPLPGMQNVEPGQFVERYRFPLDIVLLDGKVLVRKGFGGQRERFVHEWYNLAALMGKANIPAVYRADEQRYILYKNLIVGHTVRDRLVDAGAQILNVQTDHDPELEKLDVPDRLHAILARGTALLPHVFAEDFFEQMEEQLYAIHRCGVAKLSLTFGNIMVDRQGRPWFIDLEGAQAYRSVTAPAFLWQRDQDRSKYNRIYGRDIMTEAKSRQELARQKTEGPGWYAPIDFGGGLAVDGFWSVDSGTGRWEFLNGAVVAPLVRGKRVLDLGPNNGVMPIMMLRAGAREVVGLELSQDFIQEARLVQRVFEWRDMRCYALTLHHENMLAILDKDWGSFDVITAYCSLYYLEPEQMAAVVRKAASMAPVMVLQANDHTRSEAADQKAEKSSSAYLQRLLVENGFPCVNVYAPRGFSRPLLVGKKV